MANLEIEIGAVTSGLDKGLSAAESKLQSFSKTATKLGKTFSLALTAPIVAFGGFAIKAASDLEESGSKFRTVFRDIQKDAEQSLGTLRKEFGLSSSAAFELLGNTGDLLTGFGFSQEAALDLSTEVNKLAVDLASFTNFSGGAAGASDALTKALLGERESVKSLGIAILEEDVKKQVAINTAKGLTFETERQAKAYATLDLAIQQSGNAIGDYARTQDSFANQFRLLGANVADLSAQFGEVLLPVATKLVGFTNKLVTGFSELSKTTKTVIVVVAGLAAAIGPVLLAIGGIGLALPAIKAGLLAVSAVFTPLTLKIIAITAAVVALGIVAKALIDSWDVVSEFFSQLWDKIRIFFIRGVADVLKSFSKLTSVIGIDFKDTVDGLVKNAERIESALDAKPVVTIGDVWKSVTGQVKGSVNSIKDSITGLGGGFDEVVTKAGTAAESIKRVFSSAVSGVGVDDRGFGNLDTSNAGIDTTNAGISIPPINEGSKSAFLESLTEFNKQASDIITNGVANTIGDFAFSLGEALGSGANVVESLGSALLKGIAMIANQLGQAAIAIGVGMIAIKKSFSNPFTAIAAGAALVALAGVISSQVPKIASGSGGGGAGGGTTGVGQSFSGSGQNTAFVDSFGAMEIVGTSTVKGEDIIISYEKAKRTNGR